MLEKGDKGIGEMEDIYLCEHLGNRGFIWLCNQIGVDS